MTKIDKKHVEVLLATTNRSYRDIAAEVGCSYQLVGQVAAKLGLNTAQRNALAKSRWRRPRAVRPDVPCPRCSSSHIIKYEKTKKYNSQRYKCTDCGKKFLTEYKWITTGDRDRHLAQISRCSGYARPDMVARFQEMRQRIWPYLQANYSDEHLMIAAVNEAIPRTVPEYMRADICQDAIVAILENRMRQSDVTLRPFLRKWFKENLVGYRPLSLDSPSRFRDGESIAGTRDSYP